MDILLLVLVLLVAFLPFLFMVCATLKMRKNYLELQALSDDIDLDLPKSA